MIIRKEDIRIKENVNMRGGANSVFIYELLEKPMLTGAGRLFGKLVIPPKSGIGYHTHTGESEIFYVISGGGLYDNNHEGEVRIESGSVTLTPDGCGHAVYNDTDSTLVILACILFNFSGKDVSGTGFVKSGAELKRIGRNGPFGGRGRGDAKIIIEGDEFTGAGRLYNITRLNSDSSVGYHKHEGESEVYFILEGTAVFNDDGNLTEVRAGDVCLTKPGHSHGIENISGADTVFAALIFEDKTNNP